MTALLVLDVGTTTQRAAIVDERLDIVAIDTRSTPPSSPAPGLVEFDPVAMARGAVAAATAVMSRSREPPAAVGITNQRASTVVWARETGEPLAPGLGWQDLRTVGECFAAKAAGFPLAPNQSATKLAWLLDHAIGDHTRNDVCFGTVDTWLAWTLSGGSLHVTDHTNAAVTGLCGPDDLRWNERVLELFAIPPSALPAIVSSSGLTGAATALPGAPPITAIVGDQQASLVGQGCVRAGMAKITFGTGGMLDLCLGASPPMSAQRGPNGSFPIVASSRDGDITYGLEAIMLGAGANVEWLRDLGLITSAAASHEVAATVESSGGVTFVPAISGLGTPYWDFGATGTLLGATRGTTAAHIVRAVLDGVAQRGVDLLDAAIADSGPGSAGRSSVDPFTVDPLVETVRIDGGMSANPTFVQALADLAARPVEVSPIADATTRGAAFLAGLAIGVWDGIDEAAGLWAPSQIVEPTSDRSADRARWADAIGRSRSWIPELSALDF